MRLASIRAAFCTSCSIAVFLGHFAAPSASAQADPSLDGDAQSVATQAADGTPGVEDGQSNGESEESPDAVREGTPDDQPSRSPAAPPSRRSDPPSHEPEGKQPAVDAASFKGVQPGRSTEQELRSAWGMPNQTENADGAVHLTYKVESFERVRATVVEGTVSSIVIYLDKPVAPAALAHQLELDEVRLVEVRDEKGDLLGQAFPERGVMFGFAGGSDGPQVSQVLLEPLGAEPFLMRAEHTLRTDCAASIADTKLALRIEPTNPRAFWLQSEALACCGNAVAALKAAQEAVSIDSDEQYRLTLAKLLAAAADYSQAMQIDQQLVEAEASTPVARGQAACQLAHCLQNGPSHDYQQAVKYYLQAIKLAEPLAGSATAPDQRAAKRILLDAHLGLAHAVGHGSWQQKEVAVAKWLVRAKALAEELCQDQTDEEARLTFNNQSLAAWAGASDPPDPSAWIDASVRLGKQAIEQARDPGMKSRLHWELGVALANAVLIEQQREKKNTGLEYGNMAVSYLEQGRVAGQQVPGHEYIIGRLNYHIGAIHAVGRKDHKQAVAWYAKAIPLLERPVPPGMARAHQQGEAFIGMAVSFWEVANRKEGMRLTLQGTKLMEEAVEEGLVARSALAVPYGNLSSMHAQLGQQDQARRFAELAASCDESGPRQR